MAAGEITLDYDFLLDDSDPTFLNLPKLPEGAPHSGASTFACPCLSVCALRFREIKGRSTLGDHFR